MATTLRVLTLATILMLAAASASAAEVMLRGALSGDHVISATDSPATGEVAAVLGDDNVLRLDMVFAGLNLGATGAALHRGRFNENGPVLARLDIDTGATSGRIAGAQITLTPLNAAAVRAGDSYVVVSTIVHPSGAIRAQLLPQPVRLEAIPPALQPTVPPPALVDPTPVPEPEEEDD